MDFNKIIDERVMDFNKIVDERSRTYHWKDGSKFTVKEVTGLHVRPSGSHRLETKSGAKFIIAAEWIAIEIEAVRWTL
jgi:hypothetical protein